jgi:hypothetical protein
MEGSSNGKWCVREEKGPLTVFVENGGVREIINDRNKHTQG